ncbi:MAG: FAD-dependent oxidoreductase [Lentisphaeria bacterium]|nr:FAD-dependent oxidoreductase [Lentisphaeria bacterium]
MLVLGGGLPAVAAALSARQAGAAVFLAAPRPYLGEDLCATLRLWHDGAQAPDGALTAAIFAGGNPAAPARVKRVLAEALLQESIPFVLTACPLDLLVDRDGAPAGVVLATRSGLAAVSAKVVVDAGAWAFAARPFPPTAASGDAPAFWAERIILAATASHVPHSERRIPLGNGGGNLAYHVTRLPIPAWPETWAQFAEIENACREATFAPGQLRASEHIVLRRALEAGKPPSAVSMAPHSQDPAAAQPMQRLYLLGDRGVGAAETPPDGRDPGETESLAGRTGRIAAEAAHSLPRESPVGFPPRAGIQAAAPAGSLHALPHAMSPPRPPGQTLALGESRLPVLAQADVVVVGGGTTGACAAIAAAEEGVRTLVIEYQDGLGGTGTLGLIGRPYHGRVAGFSRRVPFPDGGFTTHDKMEWFRREIRGAGGEVWFSTLAFGVVREGDTVTGVAVATPWGAGVVLASVVVDGTGNADLAAAAGAQCLYGEGAADVAMQGAGLPIRPPGTSNVNTDYLLVDESDLGDVTRALVGATLTLPPTAFDLGSLIQTRERRRVVGDHMLTYLDQLAGRTYPDSIVLSASDYDAHGYPTEPIFALIPHDAETLKRNHPAPGGTCYTPYRCLLPRGVEGMLVTGLGISMHRDASAMVRMQRDLHNQGYAAGVAAAMAVRQGCSPRHIDVRELQKRLVQAGNIPADVLEHADSFPLSPERVRQASRDLLLDGTAQRDAVCRALAMVLTHAEASRPHLLELHATASGDVRLLLAKTIAVLGCADPVPELIGALEGASGWEPRVLQGSMAEYAHLPTPVDGIITALGYARDRRALPALLARLAALDAEVTLSHHRALALALERLADPQAAEPLARILRKPGMGGHALTRITPLYDKPADRRRRLEALREITLARALFRCGDWQGLGAATLESYTHDLRGLFARHAAAVLHVPPAGPSGMRAPGPDPTTPFREP